MASSEDLLLPSLTFDLIEEILYRTPAKSLLRFKSTCKNWYSLITDKKFIYNHLDQSPEGFIRYQTSHAIDPVTGIVSDSPFPDELVPDRTSYMIHCDGLMLCQWYDPDEERRMIYSNISVWNPALRKIKWIPP
ncbi:F-box protein [Cardamine amara subsp. amara]|uniref:F-box protein n=1 Tax=Cardamine amara subsp. amara TaxID=228776 RepID=A0ABD0YZB9_CARAN